MKKIFFLTVIGTFVAFTSVNAQCNSCGQQSTTSQGFTPEVFVPKAIGVQARGIAYLEYAPVSGRTLNAVVYIYTNGVVTRHEIWGEIPNPPGYWPAEFLVEGSYDPKTMKYHSPKKLNMLYTANYAMDGNGNYILKPDGTPEVNERIFFLF